MKTSDVQQARRGGITCCMSTKRDKDLEIFGKRLKAARKRRGYETAEDFARALSVDGARYRYWERGTVDPGIPMLCRMCQILGVDPNYMIPRAVLKEIADDVADELKRQSKETK